MEENYFLAKWLNDELTQEELVKFMASPDFQKYEKIKSFTSHLKVADYDEDLALIKIKQSKNRILEQFLFLTMCFSELRQF